ncbi:MAG: hypothetical protein ACRDAI_06015 [Candidatus Rhabdochlamydia sp.]
MKTGSESRLFSNNHMAVLLSVNLETEKIGIKWTKSFNNFLITGDPVISAINDDNSLEFQKEIRENPRNRPYDPKAEEGMTRWRRTEEGDLVMFEGKPVTEETMKVWSGNQDIRLIKFINGLREEILCRAFSWENKKNLQVRYKFAPASAKPCLPNVDAIIQCVEKYTPEIENVKKKGEMIFYREHPLNCFMPDYDLSATEAIDIQKWVYNRLCHKNDKNGQYFGYTNFVTVKKISFSFGYGVRRQDGIKKPPEISAWHIEIKRQAGWVLKFFINIRDFFSGIFWTSTQEPSEADKKVMKNLLQGVPLLDEERNTIVNDFAIKLGASSSINFYVACDRSEFQLEINGRARIKSFAS